MNAILTIGLIIGILLFVSVMSSIFTFHENWKYYKSTYITLPQRTFYINGKKENKDYIIVSHKFGEPDDNFAYIGATGSFKLEFWHYLHDINITYLDPYSHYWLRKYKKWWKENVNIETLPEY